MGTYRRLRRSPTGNAESENGAAWKKRQLQGTEENEALVTCKKLKVPVEEQEFMEGLEDDETTGRLSQSCLGE